MSKIKYPKGEIVWVSYYNKSKELKFITTSKPARDAYYLYEFIDGEFKKLGRAKTPTKLEEVYEIDRKINL